MRYTTQVMSSALIFPTLGNPKDFWRSLDKSTIPHKPGVYIYKDQSGGVIYVGKAVDLYHRIASYFTGSPDSSKTAVLIENIKSVEVIVVMSELEALILEANLIKKYLPRFNIKLTDDKDYLYIKVTKENFPKILTARKKELGDAGEYFGPFPSSRIVRMTLKRLRRSFPYCTQGHPSTRNNKPCFFYHLHLCSGVCAGKISQDEYRKIIRRFIKFMQGQKEDVVSDLVAEMEKYSQDQEYEKADGIKRMIEGLNYMTQSTNAQVYLENPNFVEDQNRQALEQLKKHLNLPVLPERIECYDISHTGGKEVVGSLVVLTGGDIDKRWYRKFKIHLEGRVDDVAQMKEIVHRRLNHDEWPKPDLILVDGGKGQVRGAYEELSLAGWDVPLFGLAKRMEWIYNSHLAVIKLPRAALSLRILQKIRDEAHRFAISYHRKLREGKFLGIM